MGACPIWSMEMAEWWRGKVGGGLPYMEYGDEALFYCIPRRDKAETRCQECNGNASTNTQMAELGDGTTSQLHNVADQ